MAEESERTARSGLGMLSLAVPLSLLSLLLLSGLAWVVAVNLTSGEAKGGQAMIRFEGACDWKSPMLERLSDYGLKGSFEGDDLSLQLPGLPDDLEHMPVALSRRGQFSVWEGGHQTLDHFQNAGVQISFRGSAIVVITLDQAPNEGAEVRIDGFPVDAEFNGGELQILPSATTSQEALREATDRVVQIRHPLPCEVRVLEKKAL